MVVLVWFGGRGPRFSESAMSLMSTVMMWRWCFMSIDDESFHNQSYFIDFDGQRVAVSVSNLIIIRDEALLNWCGCRRRWLLRLVRMEENKLRSMGQWSGGWELSPRDYDEHRRNMMYDEVRYEFFLLVRDRKCVV